MIKSSDINEQITSINFKIKYWEEQNAKLESKKINPIVNVVFKSFVDKSKANERIEKIIKCNKLQIINLERKKKLLIENAKQPSTSRPSKLPTSFSTEQINRTSNKSQLEINKQPSNSCSIL